MSVAAPTSFTVTGGASITISFSAWSTSGGVQAVAQNILNTTTTINSNSYAFSDFFDKAGKVASDIASGASVSVAVATILLKQLQAIIEMYIQQALNSVSVPFSIALA